MTATPYIGRFAPSPTGPLHFGSLVGALASYLHAHQQQGQWLVRMEDLDPPREQVGASDAILRSLHAHGLHWHGEVLFQSQRLGDYRDLLAALQLKGWVYRCNCNRQKIQANGGIYDNCCRSKATADVAAPYALRVQADRATGVDTDIRFSDLIQGPQQQSIESQVGDFILQRKDGLHAYQLAVVADDIEQGINHVVRGSDLLCSTARQIYLFRLLGAAVPTFGHIPVATHADGQKLSKQNHAPALIDEQASGNLFSALSFLRLQPPSDLRGAPVQEQLDWAIRHANLSNIPHQLGIPISTNDQ